MPIRYICLILALLTIGYPCQCQDLEAEFDQILLKKYPDENPGATVLVAKEGKIIYQKAFGMANLELAVPMTLTKVFQIGSLTKQFTAVAILMLEEQGKLSLEDDITVYIPDYPVQGKRITIHHLLNHTSGIRNYTSMNIMEIVRKDFAPTELINYFKDEPKEFDPGEKWEYSNSGYVLLGYIIEQVSGKTYEEFVEQELFKQLGMSNSFYAHYKEIVYNRASGYQPGGGEYVNADFLSMTIPYASGSLMSTVEDLYKWQSSLNSNKLVSKRTLTKAHTNHKLNNGDLTNYGYGWLTYDINGSPSIEHGGGIFGYTCYQIYVPKEDVYVVILTNSNGNSPASAAIKIAAMTIDKPFDPQKIQLDPSDFNQIVGSYEFSDGSSKKIIFDKDQLYASSQGKSVPIYAKDQTTFYFSDSYSELTFDLSKNPHQVVFLNRGINKTITGVKTD